MPPCCGQVLYLDVAAGSERDALMAVGAMTQSHFRSAGLMHDDGKGFNPHITIAKTSRLIGRHKRGRCYQLSCHVKRAT